MTSSVTIRRFVTFLFSVFSPGALFYNSVLYGIPRAFAYSQLPVRITADGYVYYECPGTTLTSYDNYSGVYPATTTRFSLGTVTQACTASNNGASTMEDGYLNNAATTNDGSYWTSITIDSVSYYWEAQRTGGIWSNNGVTYTPIGELPLSASSTYQTRFTDLDITGTSTVLIDVDYIINLSEINTEVALKNITNVRYGFVKRPSTSIEYQSIDIMPLTATGTSVLELEDLPDGLYDLQVTFGNNGTPFSSIVPFPLSYVVTTFTIASGTLVSQGENEYYNNLNPLVIENVYEECSITQLGGCINNSFRFLFIPSNESIEELTDVKSQLETRIPFVYLFDMSQMVSNVFDTAQAQSLDVELNLGFGNLTFIDEEMIANAPQAENIRTLISAFLWVTFALVVYRMALNIHSKETV